MLAIILETARWRKSSAEAVPLLCLLTLMRSLSPGSLRALIALYVVASMTYFITGLAARYDQIFNISRYVHNPFDLDYDTLALKAVSKEAAAAGLANGDVIESLDGQPYRGAAQWRHRDQTAHPGDILEIGVRNAKGAHRSVNVRLRPADALHLTAVDWFTLLVFEIFCCLACLVIGYWVVLARPRDPNAWLILLLLSFPEVLFTNPGWFTGAVFIFQDTWYQTLQLAGPVVVLLIGIYFPERWRVDRKLPWLKWIPMGPPIAAWPLIMISNYGEYYHPTFGSLIAKLSPWVDHTVNPASLLCILLYWIAIFDKLRSASTADARRRMRVLCAGSAVGLGSLLFFFVLLRALGVKVPKELEPWLIVLGVALTLLFPFSLAYVVVVQRAMDVKILLRIGTKYILARVTLRVLQLIVTGVVVWQVVAPLVSKKSVQLHELIVPLIICGLVFALTFFGLGKRLQAWLDRKFFREAYISEVVLHELSEQARTLTESGSLLSTISHRISEVLHVPQIGVLLRGGQVFHLQQAVGFEMTTPLLLSEKSQTVQTLLRENRPATLYREDPESWFSRAGADEKHTLDAVNAEVLLPLPGREKLMGLMTLGPKLSEEPYSPSDLRLLQSVGTQTGLALEVSELAHSLAREAAQRERMNREMEIAREVQERLFPQVIPDLPGISLAGYCRPALGVGGDYYDFIELEDGRVGLAVGDVSGKGISAALLMASLRASLRGMTLEGSHNLARLMSNVNRLVFEASTSNRYATFFFSIFDPKTRELKYVNAGHNPPVILCAPPAGESPKILKLEAGGPVVGLLRNLPYEEQSVTLGPGDLVIAYTDGISEAMTGSDEEWGEDRMIAAAEAARDLSAAEIVAHIFAAVDKFTQSAPQHDDMTLLVMKLERNG